jgi:hypothetical protein
MATPRAVVRWATVVLAALSVVGILVAIVATIVIFTGKHSLPDVSQPAMDAAKAEAVNLLALDSTNVEVNYKNALDGATDQLKKDLQDNADARKKVISAAGLKVSVEVIRVGLVSHTDTAASVLVYAASTKTAATASPSATPSASASPSTAAGNTVNSRLQLDVHKVGDRWLVSQLTVIGTL